MENEVMDLDQLASYLQRDVRELSKMANRGYLPGQKVGGQWRFASAEINHWLETQMHYYTEQELTALEAGTGQGKPDRQPLVMTLLSESVMAVPLRAGTRDSVLRELVKLAENSWQVYDPDALLHAIRQREELGSTALASGVAIPHPRRPLPDTAQGEAFIAFGRTPGGMPFNAADGSLTDLFFLVCCRDASTHLRVLARLSRMLLRPGFTEELRRRHRARGAAGHRLDRTRSDRLMQHFPVEGTPLYVSSQGHVVPDHRWDPRRPTALVPGAFNPMHAGHRTLAEVAAEMLDRPIAFELSIANVDKPPLDPAEVQRRVAQFTGQAALWLTHAPRFVHKAELFPGAIFVVGADTAVRIVDPRYYNGDAEQMHAALAQLDRCRCRFLVACRLDPADRCVGLDDVPVPPAFRSLFTAIPAERFRLDLSSTAIRSGAVQGRGAV